MKSYTARQRQEFAQTFDALGHPRRIAIYLALQQAGVEGLTFGALAKQAGIADPSLAHHIRMMKKSGIIKATIKGQFSVFTLNLSPMKSVIRKLGLGQRNLM